MLRRDKIIDGMFLDIASPEEIETVNQLYARRQKGSAVVYQLKRIKARWVELINNEHTRKYQLAGQSNQNGHAVNAQFSYSLVHPFEL